MIKQVRVDYRLLHGQVAVSWTANLGADCILLVSDTLLDDPVRVTAVKLARPAGVKVVVKNTKDSIAALKSGITDKYKLFIVCETIEAAKEVIEAIGYKELNLGGTRPGEGKKEIGTVVYVSPEETEMLKELINRGVNVYMQMVPEKKRVDIKKL